VNIINNAPENTDPSSREAPSLGGYGSGARWHLGLAIGDNNVELASGALRIEMARLLLRNGADPAVKDSMGRTWADRAERLAMFDLARLLRSEG
jgi:hypothetical protein